MYLVHYLVSHCLLETGLKQHYASFLPDMNNFKIMLMDDRCHHITSVITLHLFTNSYRPEISIYDSGVALRNCGGAQNRTTWQFLHNVALVLVSSFFQVT